MDELTKKIGKRIGDTADLPEALRKQLVSVKMDQTEEWVVATLKTRYDGVANVDEIMVGLFRDFQHVVDDRRAFSAKLYRMQKSGLLASVPKRKGVYRLPEVAEAQERKGDDL